jgi:uncharacterized alpha/beta hydrolase family protein
LEEYPSKSLSLANNAKEPRENDREGRKAADRRAATNNIATAYIFDFLIETKYAM